MSINFIKWKQNDLLKDIDPQDMLKNSSNNTNMMKHKYAN